MKKIGFLIIALFIYSGSVSAQDCDEIKKIVESNASGTSYSSPSSSSVTSVTFYSLNYEGSQRYFAVVCFTSGYSCYIYEVGSGTEASYSRYYKNSAGRAFNTYIRPYNNRLGCG